MRSDRKFNELRNIKVEKNFMQNAFTSCLIEFGLTKVICSVTIEEKIPRWLRGSGQGWLTAEYSMLPTSTDTRNDRESIRGKLSGRTQEIQRLIGRSLRNCLDLSLLSEKLIKIDCDVLTADGGTRTTSINGSWIALNLAVKKLMQKKILKNNPIKYGVSAISCGIIAGKPYIDLNYLEDSSAEADANFVFDNLGNIIEIQCTGEKTVISEKNFNCMYNLAKQSISDIYKIQSKIQG